MDGVACRKVCSRRDLSPCRKIPLVPIAQAGSPRKRNLLQELSANAIHPVTPPCSPRKMKKENTPLLNLPRAPCLKSTSRQRSCPDSGATAPKTLTPRKLSCCSMSTSAASPAGKSRENSEAVYAGTSPVRWSPKKVVRSLKLGQLEGVGYKVAKQALHTALPNRLLCRDSELHAMSSFISRHVADNRPGSLYISGAPGTGKTACLSHVLGRKVNCQTKARVVFVNCMSVRQSNGIYGKIVSELQASSQGKLGQKEAASKLVKLFTSPGPMVVLVLDEIDHLDSKGQDVLYTMFEWPSLPRSRLILIGVANALDLTDRILPRLQARPNCKPDLLHFAPYSKDQISTILLDRIAHDCSADSVIEPMAIQLCARKVAAVAGDIRKALDVCRRAVEVVENEARSQIRLGCASPDKGASGTAVRSPGLKRVGIQQVSSVISEVYGSHLASSQAQTFPLQQKIMICTLLLMVRGGRIKEVTLGKCHESYSRVCRERRVPALEQSEFLSLCQLVESRCIIGLKNAKDTRLTKISLKMNEKEVELALQDKVLLSSILREGKTKKT